MIIFDLIAFVFKSKTSKPVVFDKGTDIPGAKIKRVNFFPTIYQELDLSFLQFFFLITEKSRKSRAC